MKKPVAAFFAIFAVVFCAIFASVYYSQRGESVLSYDEALKRTRSKLKRVKVHYSDPAMAQLDLAPPNLADELPDISRYPIREASAAPVSVTIISSTEKTGTGNESWLTDAAKNFNGAGFKTAGGAAMGVTVYSIASGTAADYIISGKFVPDAFTPSNELWGLTLINAGVPLTTLESRLCGNVAGVLTSKAKHDALIQKYGEITVKTVADAVIAGEVTMGYTNPLSSSTGLNFLISLLAAFDGANPLSEQAANGFEAFCAHVPSVAFSTLEMRDAMVTRKTLDAMVLEYQLYVNEPALSDYVFTPFGVRHDSPVYAIGDLPSEKTEALEKFIEFCKTPQNQDAAYKKGFNRLDAYAGEAVSLPPSGVASAKRLWKERKNAGRPTAAVFVADVSGSMEGEPIAQLKRSLLNAANYISPSNYIGLVSYSTDVYVDMPLCEFDANGHSKFAGAVGNLSAQGATATYNAVLTALDMLADFKQTRADALPVIFLLTDGERNAGYTIGQIKAELKGLGVPVHTIGYNADIKQLSEVSSINEAATFDAKSDDIMYVLKGLFDAQM